MKNNILRGKILEFLYYLSPKKADKVSVLGAHFDYFTYDDIEKSLVYLVSKKYISVESVPHPYKSEQVNLYEITAHGIDLIEGTIQDKGIVIVQE